jgi:hypothetical protein
VKRLRALGWWLQVPDSFSKTIARQKLHNFSLSVMIGNVMPEATFSWMRGLSLVDECPKQEATFNCQAGEEK